MKETDRQTETDRDRQTDRRGKVHNQSNAKGHPSSQTDRQTESESESCLKNVEMRTGQYQSRKEFWEPCS